MLYLASQSPRRRELLTAEGYEFTVVVPDETAEDGRRSGEEPAAFVQRLAVQKARNAAEKVPGGTIIACDTVAVCGNEILGKPVDRNDAERMLRMLSGQRHFVFSGLCVLEAGITDSRSLKVGVATTELVMQPLAEEQLKAYLGSNLWQGKAGAFGYQDGNDWLRIVKGSESNVVGLPLELLKIALSEVH
ncbi:MAG: Maf family protein [Planctomycetaceae bacterium]|jgi:septum formation protein|nr:Maf family protein [Planctomycetaceae bacterium]